MSNLTKKCQNDTIHGCGQCAVSENEIRRIIEEVKSACVEAIENQHIGENPDGMMRFGASEAIKAIREVE